MAEAVKRKLVLETGEEFYGTGFGAETMRAGQVIFSTGMVGYQETISDPAAFGSLLVMTYPVIGSYGITDEDFQSRAVCAGGLIVREVNGSPSNFRATRTLTEVLEENGVPGIAGVDTRAITRLLRSRPACRGLIAPAELPLERAIAEIRAYTPPKHPAESCSAKKIWYSRTANPVYDVAAIDLGIKSGTIRRLRELGCNVTVLPCTTPADAILRLNPTGVYVSSGPGEAEEAPHAVASVRALRGRVPLLGTGLGAEVIALAAGARLESLARVHTGGNLPVKNLSGGRIEITAQCHSRAVNAASLADTGFEITHINVLDGSVEGFTCAADGVTACEFHPEGSPGPNDSAYVLQNFVASMRRAEIYA